MNYEFRVLRGVAVHKGLCDKFLCSSSVLLMVVIIRVTLMCRIRKNDRSVGILSMLGLVGNWPVECRTPTSHPQTLPNWGPV